MEKDHKSVIKVNKIKNQSSKVLETLTSGMNLMKLNRNIWKSLVERPMIALQTTTCKERSPC